MPGELFLAWAAGFFDGEGCVIVEVSRSPDCRHGFRTSLHATVTQTSLPCLYKFMEVFGGSIKTSDYRTPNGRRWSVQHVWSVRNESAVAFLRAIHPYSVVKHEQIEVALRYPLRDEHGRKYGSPANPIPDSVQQARVEISTTLREIRARDKIPAKAVRQVV